MSCVAISPRAARIAQAMSAQEEVKQIMQRIWGAQPDDWKHEIQHLLMRGRAVRTPLLAVLPSLRINPTGPTFEAIPLALNPVTKQDTDVLSQFFREHYKQAKGEGSV